MEQTSLMDIPGVDITDESALSHWVEEVLRDKLGSFYSQRDVEVSVVQKHTSIRYRGAVVCRISCRNAKARYIAFTEPSLAGYEDTLSISRLKSEAPYVRVLLRSPEDIPALVPVINAVMDKVLQNIKPLFACCSLYIQCSDAGACVNKDRNMSFACSYSRNLRKGIIFYGKNAIKGGSADK